MRLVVLIIIPVSCKLTAHTLRCAPSLPIPANQQTLQLFKKARQFVPCPIAYSH